MKRLLLLLVTAVGFISSGVAQISSYPYTEDFEGYALCGTGCGAVCTLPGGPNDWTNDLSDNLDFSTDIGGTSSSSTGPTANGGADHNPGTASGKYLFVETSCSGTGYPNKQANLLSPQLDLTGSNDMQFSFWYHLYGTSQGFMHVDVSNDFGATWTNDVVPAWTDDQDIWQNRTVSLAAWSTDIVIVRIRFITGTSFGSDGAIDDIRVFDLLQDDAGVTAFINPNLPTCVFNDSVSVEVTNFGTDTLFNVALGWEWNAAAQTPYAWTGALAQGETDVVYLGSVAYGVGDNLKAWTSLPNGVPEQVTGAGNDTTEILGLSAGLSGSYTIGGTAPDFIDFASAITNMNTFGICGPTTFDVRTGTYPEQISLGQVIGMDATNTVTFRSEAGHRDSVIVEIAASLSTENYIVRLNNADYFHFEQMTLRNTGVTYGRVLDVLGGSDWNSFWDIRFHSTLITTTSTNAIVIYGAAGSNDNYNSFTGSTIEGGSYGVYWYGVGISSLEEGTVFDGNEFVDNYYYASRVYYMDAPVFSNNLAESNTLYTGTNYAFYFYYCDNGSVITHNTVRGGATSGWRYGLYLVNCDGTSGNHGLVANNMIHAGLAANTNTFYGLYMSNSGFFDIYNNSMLTTGAGASSRSMYLTGGGANNIKNNNLVNLTGGFAAYINSNFSVTEMDNNNLWSPAGNAGYFGGNQATLAAWQAATSFDANGLSVDPGFISDFDLHVCSDSLDGKGQPLALITDDIDGQPRDAGSPDIGADEFAPLNSAFLGADAEICVGESVVLWAGSPADTILWSTGDTTNMITVTTPGTYDVIIDGPCGFGYDTIVVSASALVYTSFLEADTLEICTGESAILSSSMPADTYSWTGGASTPTLTVTAGGTYDLDITDACGSGSESIVVTEHSTPTAMYTWYNSFVTAIFTNTTGATGNVSYAWDFGDTGTSTDENPTHIYSTVGTYYVTFTVTNECGTDVYGDSVTVSSVGLNELFAGGDVAVYPNPSTGDFTLSMDVLTSSDVEIRVENMLGAIVYENKPGVIVGTHTEEVTLGGKPAGMYFVRVLAGDQQIVKKVIIE